MESKEQEQYVMVTLTYEELKGMLLFASVGEQEFSYPIPITRLSEVPKLFQIQEQSNG